MFKSTAVPVLNEDNEGTSKSTEKHISSFEILNKLENSEISVIQEDIRKEVDFKMKENRDSTDENVDGIDHNESIEEKKDLNIKKKTLNHNDKKRTKSIYEECANPKEKIAKLKQIVSSQKKKIKIYYQRLRRRQQKISAYEKIIIELNSKQVFNRESVMKNLIINQSQTDNEKSDLTSIFKDLSDSDKNFNEN